MKVLMVGATGAYAGMVLPELLGALLQIARPGPPLYDSDWPFTPTEGYATLVQKLDETPLLAGDLRALAMHGNALPLFPRLAD